MSGNIEEQLKDILKKSINFDVQKNEISAEEDLSSIGLTSKNFLKVVVNIEGEFNFEFDDEYLDFQKLRTIKDITDYIKRRVNAE